ncbi:hypothetical protein C8F01DRAFT_1121239 [Mycena amicta]|nr:hypothetical protein C8F01DRAFT_1121239 [Mycena amicta]
MPVYTPSTNLTDYGKLQTMTLGVPLSSGTFELVAALKTLDSKRSCIRCPRVVSPPATLTLRVRRTSRGRRTRNRRSLSPAYKTGLRLSSTRTGASAFTKERSMSLGRLEGKSQHALPLFDVEDAAPRLEALKGKFGTRVDYSLLARTFSSWTSTIRRTSHPPDILRAWCLDEACAERRMLLLTTIESISSIAMYVDIAYPWLSTNTRLLNLRKIRVVCLDHGQR